MAAEQIITNALKDVVQEIRVQSLTKLVRNFHGEGTSKIFELVKIHATTFIDVRFGKDVCTGDVDIGWLSGYVCVQDFKRKSSHFVGGTNKTFKN